MRYNRIPAVYYTYNPVGKTLHRLSPLFKCSLNGGSCLSEVLNSHHRIKINICFHPDEKRFGYCRHLRGIVHVNYNIAATAVQIVVK
jgi:hypothetical protein